MWGQAVLICVILSKSFTPSAPQFPSLPSEGIVQNLFSLFTSSFGIL